MTIAVFETITLTPTSRLRVKYDNDTTNPREDYAATGALTVAGPHNTIDVLGVYYFPGFLDTAHDSLFHFGRSQRVASYNPGGDQVIRWARVFHQITLVWDQEGGTYWWTDPTFMADNHPTLAVGSEEYVAIEKQVIESDLTTYKKWANGDTYGVILERLAEWHSTVDSVHRTRLEWEPIDSLWGCYLDGDYTAKQVAAEHFPLTEDEAAACKEGA
jgi:hypothetical protein